MSYRYYSTLRPLSMGTFPKPKNNRIISIENFDERTFCTEINRPAWGYIEYELPVEDGLLNQCELIKESKNNENI